STAMWRKARRTSPPRSPHTAGGSFLGSNRWGCSGRAVLPRTRGPSIGRNQSGWLGRGKRSASAHFPARSRDRAAPDWGRASGVHGLLALGTSGTLSLWDEMFAAFAAAVRLARIGRLLDADGLMAHLLFSSPSELCSLIFEQPSGNVEEGNLADLVVYDLVPSTEASGGLVPHLLMQLGQAPVAWTIVGGRVVVREGRSLSHDYLELSVEADRVLSKLWSRTGGARGGRECNPFPKSRAANAGADPARSRRETPAAPGSGDECLPVAQCRSGRAAWGEHRLVRRGGRGQPLRCARHS